MNVIHLASWQKNQLKFSHPLLDQCEKIPKDSIPDLVRKHLQGDKDATRQLILGHLSFVQWIVGRFLYYWPQTRNNVEDICSEGITAVVEVVNGITENTDPLTFNVKVIGAIRRQIEVWLNDMLPTIGAGISTNFSRRAKGEELEYQFAVPFNEAISCGKIDENFAFVDMVDALEKLKEADGEELIDLVLEAIENQHQILESELRPKDREMIEKLVSAITE